MQIVTRKVPVTEHHPAKSKKGIYQITDAFLRFWFRFVQPFMSSLELGSKEAIFSDHIRPNINGFVGFVFENAYREYVVRQAKNDRLPFIPEHGGIETMKLILLR